MENKIVITGKTVARFVEILSILLLAYMLLSDMLGWSELDTGVMTGLIGSVACTEASLQMPTKRNGEQL
ncbi:TPA: hypothetical protein ACGO9Z_000569 [Streptococcus suis]